MITISKLFTIFVLPPGCIIALLIPLIVFAPRRFKLPVIMVTALLYALSMQPVADLLLRPLENMYPPLSPRDNENKNFVEAIVILGGGTVTGSPEAGAGQDTLTPDALKRAVYAFGLRNDFSAPYVFTGGKTFDHNQDPEAVTAARLLTSLGLPPQRLTAETNSRNTWENARETAKSGYTRIILVTSAYHMPRSVYCFARNGMAVIPAPTDYKSGRNRRYHFLDFMPQMSSLQTSYTALHEYIGLFCYRLIYR